MATTFEELIGETGGFGLFQLLVVSMISHNRIQLSWSMLFMSYGNVIPDFYCIKSREDPTSSNDTLNACDVNMTMMATNGSSVVEKSSCSSYLFKPTYHSIVSEFDLVCDEEWIKATITSIQMGGVLVGNFIVGQMADLLGRKKVFFAFLLDHALFNLIAAFSINWQMFAACRFFIGIGIGTSLVMVVPYPMEFIQHKWRPVIGAIPLWSFGVCLFALAAWLLNDWKWLHITDAVLCIPGLLSYFYVPESMRWLATQGRVDEAVAVMERVAKTNGKEMPDNARQIFQDIAQTEKKLKETGKRYSYLDLVRTWNMAKLSICGCYVWFSFSTVYYGISFAVSSLAGNVFLNIFLLSVLEFPLLLCSIYLMNRFGRKSIFLSLYAFAFACCGVCLGIQILVSEDDQGLSVTILSIMAKVTILTAWLVHVVWITESYPTVIRGIGYGAVNTSARVGSILAPFLINFESMMVESYIIMCCLLFLCFFAAVFMSETKGNDLSDSLSTEKTVTTVEANGNDLSDTLSTKKTVTTVEANGNVEAKNEKPPISIINTRL